MRILDRIIAAVAPEAAFRRAQFREALARFDGARNTRRTRGWRADATGPNAETRDQLPTLRNRSRDLVQNNPWARAGVDILVSYQVGTGIELRSDTGDRALDEQADALFAEWCAKADITGRLDFAGLTAQVARARAQDGEALALLATLSAAEARRRGLRVPLAIQVVEADRLPEDLNQDLADGGAIIQGVEMDRTGMPVRFHLRDHHPGESAMIGGTYGRLIPVPSGNVLHIFRQDRAGQVRGTPDLSSVLTRLRGLDELEDAALEQAKVQACLAAFVTSNAGPGGGPLEKRPDASADQQLRTLAPGIIERLLPGEDVKFSAPSGAGSFSDLARHQLHAIAQGMRITYDLLTGDLSQANYSSIRAGRLAFRRQLERDQWTVLIPGFSRRVWDTFIVTAQRVGELPLRAGGWPMKAAPPRFEMVDPLKDAMAMRAMVRMGAMTWPQMVAEMGWDPRKQAEEIRQANDQADEFGLIFDTDPRRVSSSGGAQDAAQLAAVEIGATGAAGQ